MTWIEFIYIAIFSIFLFVLGSIFLVFERTEKIGNWFILSGITLLAAFVVFLWISLSRPPLRTLGETRLLYALFLALSGFVTYKRWGQKWILLYCNIFAVLFLLITLLKPENLDHSLTPALQSPFFPLHVIVYILGYSFLGASLLVALRAYYQFYKKNASNLSSLISIADTLVYTGFSFLTFGLIFGALWAKEAWGHYWTWDPKETWALISWFSYLLYIHLRYYRPQWQKWAFHIIVISFIIIIITWFGLNYLPNAQNSVHTY
jgi:ABC-type transport system involved in cytochrome c biogenesis permease subunit